MYPTSAPCPFQLIDLLVRLLQFPLEGAIDQTHLTRVFKAAYDVLYTYMIGNSRKNALYFAKYIDFFQTQISVKVRLKFIQAHHIWSPLSVNKFPFLKYVLVLIEYHRKIL